MWLEERPKRPPLHCSFALRYGRNLCFSRTFLESAASLRYHLMSQQGYEGALKVVVSDSAGPRVQLLRERHAAA